MTKTVPNMIESEQFEALRQRVLTMNTNIEDFVRNEMSNHRKSYDPVTGERLTTFVSLNNNGYQRVPLFSIDGALVNCEILTPPHVSDSAILYVHGAAFQRRSNDINLKTADRLCSMTGHSVCVPDYRVGADYTYEQMVDDVIVGYRYLVWNLRYQPERITILADSSGCVTALQAVRELGREDLPAPGKIVLWSPQADEKFDASRIAEGKKRDIALRTNDLFSVGFNLYLKEMGKGKSPEKIYPLYGDYGALKNSKVLIQAGAEEMLIEDAYKLHDLFAQVCPSTLEVYEDMFHNFQTYYSICDMAKVCWKSVIEFITDAEK